MDSDTIVKQREDLLKRQKDLSNSASSRKGQRAQNKPTRSELETAFSPNQAALVASSNVQHALRQTVIGYSYPPCTTPLVNLEPITINELRLENHHTGRVLFARIFGTPFRLQAVQGAIFDVAGGVDRIAIYNFELGLSPASVLPAYAILAIKQPYYKVTVDGGVTVRVDHPSDLVLLFDHDGRAPSALWPTPSKFILEQDALSLKARGNQAFKEKNHRKAVELYTRGLNSCPAEQVTLAKFDLYRNRAIANINLRRYEAALADAEASILPEWIPQASENNAKALYRAGCAAYQLRDFPTAEAKFSAVLGASPSDLDAVRELKRTRKRLTEQSKGEYDFKKMAIKVNPQCTRLDHADFMTKVQVRSSKTGGNGLFARHAIRTGELVLCEKAFEVAYEQDQSAERTVIINLNRDSASIGTHATRLVAVVHKMLHSPTQAAKFLRLHDGGYSPKTRSELVDGLVPVDTFQVQAALEINGFGCPSTSTLAQVDTDSTVGCDSTGAWIIAALINHDCIGNAQRAFIGDMMIVHATKDIAKDEEILMRYMNADDDNAEFQKTLQQSWNFTCRCRLCIAEGSSPDGPKQVRIAMLKRARAFLDRNQITQLSPPKPGIISRAEKLRAQVARSYDAARFKGLPCIGLHDLDHWLCMAYILSGAENKVREAGLAVLRDQGLELTIKKDKVCITRPHCRPDVTGIHAATYIAAGYYKAGNIKIGDQLEALAQELYRIGYGTTHGYHSRSSSG